MIGKVIRYNQQRGFGFIKGPNGKSVFVNYTAINNSRHRYLKAGQSVRFAVARGLRGPQAVKVQPLNRDQLH